MKSQCLQLYFVENNCVVSSFTSSTSTKSLLDRFNEVSNESAKRVSIPSLITILSIITLIECFLFLSNSGRSPTSNSSSSILKRMYPSFINLSINFLCVPFLSFTIGATICILLRSCICIIASTIWLIELLSIFS